LEVEVLKGSQDQWVKHGDPDTLKSRVFIRSDQVLNPVSFEPGPNPRSIPKSKPLSTPISIPKPLSMPRSIPIPIPIPIVKIGSDFLVSSDVEVEALEGQ